MLAAAVFLSLGSGGKPVSQSENLPSFHEFHQRIWAGEIDLADNALKVVYGRVHWEQLMQNVRQPRLDEALEIVSARKSGQGIVRLLPLAEGHENGFAASNG